MTPKEKVNEACKNSEQPLDNHFADFHEMVPTGSRQNEKWISELLECDDCCYAYRSVHIKGLYKLECPNCGNISKHNKIYDTNHEKKLINVYNSIYKKNNKSNQNDTEKKPVEEAKKNNRF